MSLIFAALKKLDDPSAATPVGIETRHRSAVRHWTLPAVAIGGALLAGWWLYPFDHQTIATHAETGAALTGLDVAPAAIVATAAVATTFPLTSATGNSGDTIADRPAAVAVEAGSYADASHRAVAPATDPALAPAIAQPSSPAAPAAFQSMPAVATATPDGSSETVPAPAADVALATAPEAATPKPSPSRPPASTTPPSLSANAITVRDASEATIAPEDRSVDRFVATVGSAIQAGDFGTAQTQLTLLAKQLPPRSLTLLRLQAWLAHESGDHVGALVLYRQIVDRMPGDQTSVINLAILEARNGEVDSARERLRHLRARDTDSREIERAIGMVEAQLQ